LEVDTVTGGFRRNQDLGGLAEFTLGIDATSRHVAIADLHPVVDLRDGEPPLDESSERPLILPVTREKIQ
jgi:hypothetical protein